MNLQLSDQRIRATCRELVKKHGSVTGAGLCEELRSRFGAVGKTMRVFRIWRRETEVTRVLGVPGCGVSVV
jgi:hypothetical protein